jgi:hypothetical protein
MLTVLAHQILDHELGNNVISLVGLTGVDVMHVNTTVPVEVAVRRPMRSGCKSSVH